jgi:hypothetical protein
MRYDYIGIMKTRPLIICILLSIAFTNIVCAQLVVKCAGRTYFIPDFRDTAVGKNFTEEQFEKLNILKPIQDSEYDIELRGYYEVVTPFMGSVVIIKANSKKLVAESYYYRIQRDVGDAVPPVGFSVTRWANRNLYYSMKAFIPSDTLFQSLIQNRLFSLPDSHTLIQALKKEQINVEPTRAMDPYYMKFELKVNQRYRSFFCDPFAYWTNKNIKELLPEKNLFDAFNNLYIKSGQELNHLFP